jgi:hypothetical protein
MTLDTVKMHRATLAFDDVRLEREFLDEYADSVRLQMRYLCLAGVVVVFALNALDAPGDLGSCFRFVRNVMDIPAFAVGIGVSFQPPRLFRRLYAFVYGIAGWVLVAVSPVTVFVAQRWVPSWNARDDLFSSFFFFLVTDPRSCA